MNTMQPQEILNLVWQLAMTVKKQKKYFHHSAIASFLTRENLAILAQHRMSKKILQSILAKLEIPDRVRLCRDILPAIDIVPDDWRAIVFANSFDIHSLYHEDSILDNELEWLIHFQQYRKKYCQHGRPGCNELKCLDLAPPKIKPWSPKLQASITQDHIPSFMLLAPMEQPEITPAMIAQILDDGAFGIFSTLVEHIDILPIQMTMKQILYYAVSHLDDRTGTDVIDLLLILQHTAIGLAVEGLVEVLLLEEGVEDSEVVLDLCRFLLGVVVGVRDRVAQRVFDFTGCQDLKNGLHVLERERHFVLFEVIDLRDGTEHRVVVATEGHEHLRADLHILIRNVIKRAHHAFRFNGAITIDVHWLPPWVCLLPAL